MTTKTCMTCGVKLVNDAEENGLHPVQEPTETDDGMMCGACSDEDREHTGAEIVAAANVDHDDDELADVVCNEFGAEELRRWVGAHDDITRERGATKRETAEQIVEQDRVEVASTLAARDAFVDGPTVAPHEVHCPNCAYSDAFGTEDAAKKAAKEHKSDNPTHFPKAWASDGRNLYGQ